MIAFDKTGTLTKGVPVITDLVQLNGPDENELLSIAAAAIEKGSQHPLASAIIRKAADINTTSQEATEFTSITGKGAKAFVDGVLYYIGSPRLFEEIKPLENVVSHR